MCVFDVLPANVGHFVCKIADTQLVYDFSELNRGPNPVHVIVSFFVNIPLYARVGNLQPFAHIHKSWTVLVCNVVLGLNVECRSMSSVDGAYKLTPGGGGGQCHWDLYHIRENQFPQSTLNGDLIPGQKDTQNGDNGPFCIYITPFFSRNHNLNGDRSRVNTYTHLFSINTWKEKVLWSSWVIGWILPPFAVSHCAQCQRYDLPTLFGDWHCNLDTLFPDFCCFWYPKRGTQVPRPTLKNIPFPPVFLLADAVHISRALTSPGLTHTHTNTHTFTQKSQWALPVMETLPLAEPSTISAGRVTLNTFWYSSPASERPIAACMSLSILNQCIIILCHA